MADQMVLDYTADALKDEKLTVLMAKYASITKSKGYILAARDQALIKLK